jgi:hypothetical protein
MNIKTIITLSIFIWSSHSQSMIDETGYNEYCQETLVQKVACHNGDFENLVIDTKSRGIPTLDGEVGELFKVSTHKKEYLESYIDQWKGFFRFVRNKNSPNIPIDKEVLTSPVNKTLFTSLEKGMDDLKIIHEISDEIKKLKKSKQGLASYDGGSAGSLCYEGSKGCASSIKLELDGQISELNKIRQILIAKNSWWLEPSLVKGYKPNSQNKLLEGKTYSKDDLQFAINSFGQKLELTTKGISELEQFNAKILNGEIAGPNINLTSASAFNQTKVIDGALNYAFLRYEGDIPIDKSKLCSLALRKSKLNKKVKAVKDIIDYGALGLSFLPHPASLGLKVASISRGTFFTAQKAVQLGLFSSMGVEYLETEKECSNLSLNYGKAELSNNIANVNEREILSNDSIDDVKKIEACYEKKDQLYDSLLLGAVSGMAIKTLPILTKHLGHLKNKAVTGIKAYKGRQSSVVVRAFSNEKEFQKAKQNTLLDISNKRGDPIVVLESPNGLQHIIIDNRRHDEFSNLFKSELLLSDVEDRVIGILRERLPQITAEKGKIMKDFSLKSRNRTITIAVLNPDKKDEILGAVTVIESQRYKEKLFLEESLDGGGVTPSFKLPRRVDSSTTAEVGRLAVDSKIDPKGVISAGLLDDAFTVVLNNPNLKGLSYYTSNIHHRLYSRFMKKKGVSPGTIVYKPNDKEVVVTYDLSGLEKAN